MHPLYDPSTLTDDELQDKLSKANQMLNYQSQFGRQQSMNSIRQVIDTLEYERERRIYVRQKTEEDKTKTRQAKSKDGIPSQNIELGHIVEDGYKDEE
jgi:hypothetical protein